MGNCKDCKFWGRYRERQCDKVDSFFPDESIKAEIWVSVLDDSGLSVGLITGPMFGCVHFTAKGKRK